jgi:hypothetical protein
MRVKNECVRRRVLLFVSEYVFLGWYLETMIFVRLFSKNVPSEIWKNGCARRARECFSHTSNYGRNLQNSEFV